MRFGRQATGRIVALQDFTLSDGTFIESGTPGGFIESSRNLAQSGNCWVYPSACVTGNACVSGDAVVGTAGSEANLQDTLKIVKGVWKILDSSNGTWGDYTGPLGGASSENTRYDDTHGVWETFNEQTSEWEECGPFGAVVADEARVYGKAIVSEGTIYGKAKVADNAVISGSKTAVSEEASIYGNARIQNGARIDGKARVFGDARCVGTAARVGASAKISGCAIVRGLVTSQITQDDIDQRDQRIANVIIGDPSRFFLDWRVYTESTQNRPFDIDDSPKVSGSAIVDENSAVLGNARLEGCTELVDTILDDKAIVYGNLRLEQQIVDDAGYVTNCPDEAGGGDCCKERNNLLT